MLGYVTIGVNDMDKAVQFYDGLLGEIGARHGRAAEAQVRRASGEHHFDSRSPRFQRAQVPPGRHRSVHGVDQGSVCSKGL